MPRFRTLRASLPLLALLVAACATPAPPATRIGPGVDAPASPEAEARGSASIAERFTKREAMIPMRDGTRLYTAIYAPRDAAASRPIMLMRTPYSCRPYGEDRYPGRLGLNPLLVEDGYIFVVQDVRGTYRSEGRFVNMRPHRPRKEGSADVDESTDTWDTIDWLVANVPGNNGRVGMWGISYPGFYVAAGMIDAHPALRAVSPQAPIADWWYDDFHHHGAFFLPHAFGFLSSFGHPRPEPTTTRPGRSFTFPTPDGYAFYLAMGPLRNANDRWLHGEIPFWNHIVAHPNYDEFWRSRSILPHLDRVPPSVMTVGGWFDAEDLHGPLSIYRAVERRNPGVENVLVMGPWVHGGWSRTEGDRLGEMRFGAATSRHYRAEIERRFFDERLRGTGTPVPMPEATVFETGGNRWREFTAWPPADAQPRTLYLHRDGRLRAARPERRDPPFLAFVSDPAKPVPFTAAIALGMTKEYMTEDQRFAARRPDVLVWTTEPLEEDLVVAGPIEVDLHVATTGRDADWVVKLIDVLPDDAPDPSDVAPGVRMGGYQMMIRSEVMRGRFRRDPATPVPFEPGVPDLVRVPLLDVCHRFKAGHRIMIQVQSTWFPLVDRNPQTWVENIYLAEERDFQAQEHRVFVHPAQASRVVLPVIPDPDALEERGAGGR